MVRNHDGVRSPPHRLPFDSGIGRGRRSNLESRTLPGTREATNCEKLLPRGGIRRNFRGLMLKNLIDDQNFKSYKSFMIIYLTMRNLCSTGYSWGTKKIKKRSDLRAPERSDHLLTRTAPAGPARPRCSPLQSGAPDGEHEDRNDGRCRWEAARPGKAGLSLDWQISVWMLDTLRSNDACTHAPQNIITRGPAI